MQPGVTMELRADLQQLLHCGAQFRVAADHENFPGSAADRETTRDMGNLLLNQVDQALAEAGMSEDERQQLGFDAMQETMQAFEDDALAVDGDTCLNLVDVALAGGSGGEDAVRNEKIDMLMTCGGGFYFSAQALREEGKTEDADMLEQLGIAQIDAAEDLMIEAGMGEAARFQVSQLYGESVSGKLQKGEELEYDWDTCAALEF
jgi:hypothetical protein